MLHALIMAGGSGTRFWPASRRRRPKHLLKFGCEVTLLEQARDRLGVPPERVWVVTIADQAEAVRRALPNLPGENVIAEPCGRDTAAALGLGAQTMLREDPEALFCAMPADHIIAPPERFRAAVDAAVSLLFDRPDAVVTIGIRPTGPATGFGYLKRGAAIAAPGEGAPSCFHVDAFREKPDRETAQRYLESGDYDWNAGIFCWRAVALAAALEGALPETAAAVKLEGADLAEAYAGLEKISIDYAVLESHPEVLGVASDFTWSDVGSWTALPALFGADADGNTVVGARHVGLDSRDLIVHGDGRLVATVGLEGVVIVQTPDALLVCRRDRVQDVKKLVAELGARGEAEVL